MPGTIYLVGTPLGNLEDITLRALRVLREVDVIACEDTRRTRKLLDHFGIRKPLLAHHEHNEEASAKGLAARAQAGEDIALVSDAGMPGISDPGFRVVQEAIQAGIAIVPIPGPVALETALAVSGLPTDSFRFEGFLPSRKSQRVLAELKAKNRARGEITLLIGRAEATRPSDKPIHERFAELLKEGTGRMEAIKQAAKEFGIPKSEAYRLVEKERSSD